MRGIIPSKPVIVISNDLKTLRESSHNNRGQIFRQTELILRFNRVPLPSHFRIVFGDAFIDFAGFVESGFGSNA